MIFALETPAYYYEVNVSANTLCFTFYAREESVGFRNVLSTEVWRGVTMRDMRPDAGNIQMIGASCKAR